MKPEILERMPRPRPKGRQSFENRLGKFERDLTLLKWMLGFNLALTVAIVARLLLGAVIDAIFLRRPDRHGLRRYLGHVDAHPAVTAHAFKSRRITSVSQSAPHIGRP